MEMLAGELDHMGQHQFELRPRLQGLWHHDLEEWDKSDKLAMMAAKPCWNEVFQVKPGSPCGARDRSFLHQIPKPCPSEKRGG